MKRFSPVLRISISVLLFASSQQAMAMDHSIDDFDQFNTEGMAWLEIEQDTPPLTSTLNTITINAITPADPSGYMGLPREVLLHIFSSIRVKTCLQLARLIALQSVCKVWLKTFTIDLIQDGLSPHKNDKSEGMLFEECSQKLLGRGLAAQCRRFCMRTLWPTQTHQVVIRHLCNMCQAIEFNGDKFNHSRVEEFRRLLTLYPLNPFNIEPLIKHKISSVCSLSKFDTADDKYEVLTLFNTHVMGLTERDYFVELMEKAAYLKTNFL